MPFNIYQFSIADHLRRICKKNRNFIRVRLLKSYHSLSHTPATFHVICVAPQYYQHELLSLKDKISTNRPSCDFWKQKKYFLKHLKFLMHFKAFLAGL